MLRALMKKVDNIQDWISDANREMKTLKKKIFLIKNTVTEMKNAFDGQLKKKITVWTRGYSNRIHKKQKQRGQKLWKKKSQNILEL